MSKQKIQTSTEEKVKDSSSFETALNHIMEQALSLTIVEAAFNPLVSLITNPEEHVKKLLLPGGGIIDERKQYRELEAFTAGSEFQELIKAITVLKANYNWIVLIQGIEFYRTAGSEMNIRMVANMA